MLKLKKWKQAVITITTFMFVLELIAIANILLDKPLDPGSVTDWFSAIADLLMAGAAIYAAWNAKDWFKTKIKENALNKVTLFLNNCDVFSMDMRNLYLRVSDLNNTDPDSQPNDFAKLIFKQRETIDEMQIKLISLKTELKSLIFWNVEPRDEKIFKEYFSSNSRALIKLSGAIGFNIDDYYDRVRHNVNYGRELLETSKSLRTKHDNLKRNINELFIFP
ncbi:hypothetical protein [Pseudescherichia vulneris]|uniref:hypothetical protein n=1 Tax=Pseudescherichia vulneris TaxID=566 RepID=UPI0028A8C3AA|nr:hypothetical protein [Pseudescherichia vulneris]